MEAEFRPKTSPLAIRFAVILALAMLPAGIVAIAKTTALEREVQARSEAALLGATLQAAADETGLVRRVRGIVASLAASLPYVVADAQACNALMEKVALAEPTASLVAFIPVSGVMDCSSSGEVYDFSASPLFKSTLDAREPHFVVNPNGPISGTSVLGISHPVFDLAGVYLGVAVVSLPHRALAELNLMRPDDAAIDALPVVYWTFDGQGTLLTSSIDIKQTEGQTPAVGSLQDFVGRPGSVFQARSRNGVTLTYALAPIVADELYVMSAFVSDPLERSFLQGITAYIPLMLMWLAGLVVSGFAAELLVARHVRTLNRSIVAFARGDRRLQDLDMNSAPAELAELGEAYQVMTESIVRSEAELEDSVHQKEVLLREVHHRVKNNLQLISSILNIQIRTALSGEAKDLLKNLQERIMSLATVHRELYQTSGLADVRARELIPDIVRQIMQISAGPERPFKTETEIDDLRLVPDQAVPLSLLLAEALTNAMKHSGVSRHQPGLLTIRLKRLGGSGAVLEVTNTTREAGLAEGAPSGFANTGIGSQLISAFVQQLGGKQESGVVEGGYSLKVSFDVTPLSLAENRQAPSQS